LQQNRVSKVVSLKNERIKKRYGGKKGTRQIMGPTKEDVRKKQAPLRRAATRSGAAGLLLAWLKSSGAEKGDDRKASGETEEREKKNDNHIVVTENESSYVRRRIMGVAQRDEKLYAQKKRHEEREKGRREATRRVRCRAEKQMHSD